jgi:hypothetical protein
MQSLHLSSLPLKFSRAHPSSSLLFSEQTFIVRVRLALLSRARSDRSTPGGA